MPSCKVLSTYYYLRHIHVSLPIMHVHGKADVMLQIAHPHRKIQLRNVVNLPNKPVLYATPGKMDMIFGKLETFLEQDKIELNEQEQRTLSQSKAAIQQNDAKSLDMQHWHQLLGEYSNHG